MKSMMTDQEIEMFASYKCIGGEKFDPIVDEVNRVIADKGPILKKFVATALKYIEDQA